MKTAHEFRDFELSCEKHIIALASAETGTSLCSSSGPRTRMFWPLSGPSGPRVAVPFVLGPFGWQHCRGRLPAAQRPDRELADSTTTQKTGKRTNKRKWYDWSCRAAKREANQAQRKVDSNLHNMSLRTALVDKRKRYWNALKNLATNTKMMTRLTYTISSRSTVSSMTCTTVVATKASTLPPVTMATQKQTSWKENSQTISSMEYQSFGLPGCPQSTWIPQRSTLHSATTTS